jgi:phosphatidate cytidylyltransferase
MDAPRPGDPPDGPAAAGDSAANDPVSDRLPGGQVPEQGPERAPEQAALSGTASRAGRDLPRAIGVGLALGALCIGSLLIYRQSFVVIIVAAVAASIWELRGTLSRSRGITITWIPMVVGAAATVSLAWPYGQNAQATGLALTALACMIWRFPGGARGFVTDLAVSVFVVVYLGLFASFATLMLAAPDGAARIITFMIMVVCSDTGGYAAGVLFGRHPMAPTISPKKSWEGFAGSTLAAMVGGALCLWLLLDGQWWQGVVAGAAVAVVATAGDLTESLIKRDLGVKDMGNLLPGHGGVMDRMDSLLPSAVVTWALLALFVPVGAVALSAA